MVTCDVSEPGLVEKRAVLRDASALLIDAQSQRCLGIAVLEDRAPIIGPVVPHAVEHPLRKFDPRIHRRAGCGRFTQGRTQYRIDELARPVLVEFACAVDSGGYRRVAGDTHMFNLIETNQ